MEQSPKRTIHWKCPHCNNQITLHVRVTHDGPLLAEDLLMRSHNVVSLQLAPADTDAIDLSGITYGIPLEISLREMTDVRLTPLLSKVTKTVDALHVKQLLVAPSQVQSVFNT